MIIILYWLVVFRHPSEKYGFVNWDDDEIPNINGKMPKMATKPPTSNSCEPLIFLHRFTIS